jgi:hypothetical protein
MKTHAHTRSADSYRDSMGQLLVLYTQVDRLIMEICAERIATAPDLDAKLALAKQVGDEGRHVLIQHDWMEQFGTTATPVISDRQEALIRSHLTRLRSELAQLPVAEREAFLAGIPQRIETLTNTFHGFGLDVADLFEGVGASYAALCEAVRRRRDEVLEQVAA